MTQRDAALALANRRRLRNAELRRKIAALPYDQARHEAARVIENPVGHEGLALHLLLRAVPTIGPHKASRLAWSAGIRTDARLRDLNLRQRKVLAHRLRGGMVFQDKHGFARAA